MIKHSGKFSITAKNTGDAKAINDSDGVNMMFLRLN